MEFQDRFTNLFRSFLTYAHSILKKSTNPPCIWCKYGYDSEFLMMKNLGFTGSSSKGAQIFNSCTLKKGQLLQRNPPRTLIAPSS